MRLRQSPALLKKKAALARHQRLGEYFFHQKQSSTGEIKTEQWLWGIYHQSTETVISGAEIQLEGEETNLTVFCKCSQNIEQWLDYNENKDGYGSRILIRGYWYQVSNITTKNQWEVVLELMAEDCCSEKQDFTPPNCPPDCLAIC